MREIFFFKQKTAYEMRISNWSSDVCSSALSRSVTKRLLAPSDGVLVQRGPKARPQGVQVLRRPASRGMSTFVTGARVSKEARALCFRQEASALQRQGANPPFVTPDLTRVDDKLPSPGHPSPFPLAATH